MRFRPTFALTTLVFAGLFASAPADAQSASEILRSAMAQHEARMKGIENYTLVQQTMGMETTVYFEREMGDGRAEFRPRHVSVAGQVMPIEDGAGWDTPYAGFAEIANRARLTGTETIDGNRTHVLVIDDFAGLPGLAPPAGQPSEMEFRQGTIYLDASSYVLRKMVMEGIANVEGQNRPVTMEARFEDYRDVSGLLHPFRTVMTTSGLTPDVSAQDMEQARRSMAELKAQMESMPAAQRRMMERVVQPQIERFEQMLAGDGMSVTLEVTDLRVNTGPPAGR